MSVSFYIAIEVEGGTRYVYRCDCDQRWCDACDIAWEKGEQSPEQFSCENCTDVSVNLHQQNAADWMRWVGIDASKPYGEIKASQLAALCRRRLWDEARNHDQAVSFEEYQVPGRARVIAGHRPEGRLRDITEQMLRVCEKAGDRLIAWA